MLQILQVAQMKDYIHQSLAYIAYTTTVATQKVSFFLFEDMIMIMIKKVIIFTKNTMKYAKNVTIIVEHIRLTRASSSSATILIAWDQLLENWRSRFFSCFHPFLKKVNDL